MVKSPEQNASGNKRRLDLYLVENRLCDSREKAKALIIAGSVRVDGSIIRTPSFSVRSGQIVSVDQPAPYVSRGGLKLEKAIDAFSLDLDNCVCADIGASTGGFTDCMLQNGAQHVYAIDVGYGQLAWKLRNDPRVQPMERTNARYLEALDRPVDFASVDVSFISLLLILPAVMRILGDEGHVVALIKPQFEAGRASVGKKGVVRDPAVHEDVIRSVINGARELGLTVQGLTCSPIKGPNGNIEYLVHLSRVGEDDGTDDDKIATVVAAAHSELNRSSKADGTDRR